MNAAEIVSIGAQLLAVVARIVIDAIEARDVSALRRVGDVLPAGHALRSRLALLAEEERARRDLGGGT